MKILNVTDLDQELAAVEALDIHALRQRWGEVFKSQPPMKVRSGFLKRAIAYRLQEQVLGGLKPETKRLLRKLAEQQNAKSRALRQPDSLSSTRTASQPILLAPGTRLMREWNGSTEIVEVLEAGFGWRGRTYKTLTAVALAITGTKWSGPKFFGLRVDQAMTRTGRRGLGAARGVAASKLSASLERVGSA